MSCPKEVFLNQAFSLRGLLSVFEVLLDIGFWLSLLPLVFAATGVADSCHFHRLLVELVLGNSSSSPEVEVEVTPLPPH